MENYSIKDETIIILQKNGYELYFILNNANLLCLQDHQLISPVNFEVTETYRFRSSVLPGEHYTIYGINSANNGNKGILITSCSAIKRGLSAHLSPNLKLISIRYP
jgi:hypothetical protein